MEIAIFAAKVIVPAAIIFAIVKVAIAMHRQDKKWGK